jgi:uncharacterized paraquat-inducible protein A
MITTGLKRVDDFVLHLEVLREFQESQMIPDQPVSRERLRHCRRCGDILYDSDRLICQNCEEPDQYLTTPRSERVA